MGTPTDHYVTFLERELQILRDALVEEFGFVPTRDGAVHGALTLIRELKGLPRFVGNQTQHQLRVEEMMRGFGQEVPDQPLGPSSGSN